MCEPVQIFGIELGRGSRIVGAGQAGAGISIRAIDVVTKGRQD